MNEDWLESVKKSFRYWIAFIGLRRLLSGVVTTFVGLFVLWLVLRPSPAPVESLLPMATLPSSTTTSVSTPLTVHVAGAVRSPGVYQLAPRSRVIDAVTAAGGALDKADLERINLAQLLVDTEQVFIPLRQSSRVQPTIAPRHRPTTTLPSAQTNNSGAPTSGGLVDLNSATATQLDALPGVGPATAKAIIDYRTSKGKFSQVEDLLNVAGIGAAKFAALKDLVTVAG